MKKLIETDRKIALLTHILNTIEWQRETDAPPASLTESSEQASLIASEIHRLTSGDETAEAIEKMKPENDFERAVLRVRKKEWEQARLVPAPLVEKISSQAVIASGAWAKAREEKRFDIFAEALTPLVDSIKERCDLIRKEKSRYDALLDEFEEGLTQKKLDELFGENEPVLKKILEANKDRQVDDGFLKTGWPVDAQKKLHREVMTKMGFDFNRGTLSISRHPFTTTLGRDDIRITTRFTDPSVMDSFYSIVHECGHALYEQHTSRTIRNSTLSTGASYGFHESQSRLWENVIGRSQSFLSYWYPRFRELFSSNMEGISFEQFFAAVNKVQPSYIRTNSDEVSYNLHIMLRYEVEKALMKDALEVKDIPELWNAEFERLLSLKVSDPCQGALQDSHWSGAAFGYFPTYAVGNFISVAVYDKMKETVDVDTLLQKGDYTPLTDFLEKNIWRYGMLYTPGELLLKATGRPLSAEPFNRYLTEKYL